MKYIKNQCEILMGYPIGKLFTSDTPTTKEKKHEARCEKIVDSYYSISNKNHQAIRSLLNDLESSFLLGGCEIIIPLIADSAGRLQARYEAHKKIIDKAIKPERILQEYYMPLSDGDWFGSFLLGMVKLSEKKQFPLDGNEFKVLYYKAYKCEKRVIKDEF